MSQQARDILTRPYRRYAIFSGRSTRAEFWLFLLGALILFQIVNVAYYITNDGGKRDWHRHIHQNIQFCSDYNFDKDLFDWDYFDLKDQRWQRFDWQNFVSNRYCLDETSATNPTTNPATNPDKKPQSGAAKTATINDQSNLCAIGAVRQSDNRRERYCFVNHKMNMDEILVTPPPFVYWLILKTAVALFLILPFLALISRRLHDCGRSAWWMLFMVTGPTAFLLFLYIGFVKSKPENN